MLKKRTSRQVRVGNIRIGGGAPVSIQSMTKVKTSSIRAVIAQIRRLEECGCEIVRLAVKDMADADALRTVRKEVRVPLVADIHFDHRLALASIISGANKIRINPGNMRRPEHVEAVVRAAKKAGIPIRIGVNSGSIVRGPAAAVRGKALGSGAALIAPALRYIRVFERMKFRDIVVSVKASDVPTTIAAYRQIAARCDYPLHLGVTASGPREDGIVKSAIGIGGLLVDGIGDTVRVSLTGDPVDEVAAAKRILSASGARRFGPEILSCPTCGRCQVDLVRIVDELDRKLSAVSHQLSAKRPLTIAVMGCEVNGPGEAREADIGIAAGKGSGALFIKGRIVKRVAEKDFVRVIIEQLKSRQR